MTPSHTRVRILIPVFDDWTAVRRVLDEVGLAMESESRRVDVLLVDDGSLTPAPADVGDLRSAGVGTIEVLRLRRNLGHQRAIAIGLAYLEAEREADAVVIMDGDGEDRPTDVLRLVHAAQRDGMARVVFAERTRRSEGLLFAVLYHTYRAIHWLLTGERVRVGNFSVVPAAILSRLVAVSDLWNHYAAAVFKSRLPYTTVSTTRGVRYAGQSRMNYVALVTHGLSAMAAFGDRIGVRLLTATLLVTLLVVCVLGTAVATQLFSGTPLPDWAPFVGALFLLVIFQGFAVALTFVFVILGGRDSSTFLPLRDYRHYILDIVRVRSASHDAV